jgi:predicted nucleotidyltransferase
MTLVTFVGSIPGEIFTFHGIRLAYLFGSSAMGCPGAQSDADVAVLLRESYDPSDLCGVLGKLEALISKALGCPAHVLALNGASALLGFEAIRHGRLLFVADEAERIQFEVRVLKEYDEFSWRQDFYYRAMVSRLTQIAP